MTNDIVDSIALRNGRKLAITGKTRCGWYYTNVGYATVWKLVEGLEPSKIPSTTMSVISFVFPLCAVYYRFKPYRNYQE